jgi:type IX secretion system PorP/SprF family membrane protein
MITKKSIVAVVLNTLIISMLLVCCYTTASGQDIHFSQFFETPLMRNPAMAGMHDADMRFQVVHKDQWRSVTVPFQTTSINLEYRMKVGRQKDFISVGVQAFSDKAGSAVLKTVQILPVINYHKSLSDVKPVYFSVGFIAGYSGRSYDRTKVRTSSQFDGFGFNPNLPTGELLNGNLGYFDAGLGIAFNTQYGTNPDDRLLLGLAYHHLNKPASNFKQKIFSNLEPKWVYTAGIQRSLNSFSSVLFQADYYRQGTHRELIGGFLYSYILEKDKDDFPLYVFKIGSMYRWKDAIIPVIKFDYKSFSGGISYDINTSLLKTASQLRGGFELSFTYLIYFDKYNSTRRQVFCPRL